LADRDPNAQHQGGALEARTSKEAGGFGVARWSRTPCERPDSIRGAQRGPGRQQVELEFWGLKPQITCWSRPLSRSAARFATVFLVKQNRKSQFFGFFTPKVTSTSTLMSRTTGRRNTRDDLHAWRGLSPPAARSSGWL